jgi:hypothetical protein
LRRALIVCGGALAAGNEFEQRPVKDRGESEELFCRANRSARRTRTPFMKRHLSFVAALGICLYVLTVTGHGQDFKTGREAAVPVDGNSSPTIGIAHEKLEELVRGAKLSRERVTI